MQKLVENFTVSASALKIVSRLSESLTQITRDGKSYKCIAAYTFPLSRPDKFNLNDRLYSSKLWRNVLAKRQGEGRYGLCDHPDEKGGQPDGSVKDGFCVWHNLRLETWEGELLLVGDAYLFGVWGAHCEEAIQAGGDIGLSTVGYGDFLDDGKEIDPDNYDLDRPADWVLNPSYEVFGNESHRINNAESVNTPRSVVEASEPESNKELVMKDKIQSFEEKSFRFQMTQQIAEADRETNLSVKQSLYSGLLEYFMDGVAEDLRTSLTSKIEANNKEILSLAEKGLTVGELESSNTQLKEQVTEMGSLKATLSNKETELTYVKENYDKTLVLCDSLKSYSAALKEMYDLKCSELSTKISATEYKELQAYCETLEAEIAELKRQRAEATLAQVREKDKDDKDTDGDDKGEPFGGKKAPPFQKGNKAAADDDDEDKDKDKDKDDEEDKDKDKDEKKKESDLRASASVDVLNYYVDLLARNPEVKRIENDILQCRTMLEAQTVYLRLRSLVSNRESLYRTSTAAPVVGKSVSYVSGGNSDRAHDSEARPLPLRQGWN